MEELKEQIARKLHSEFGATYGYSGTEDYIWKRIPQDERDEWLEMAGQRLTLFQNWLKKELDGLEVMEDGKIARAMGHSLIHMKLPINRKRFNEGKMVAQAELDDVRKHFKEDKNGS